MWQHKDAGLWWPIRLLCKKSPVQIQHPTSAKPWVWGTVTSHYARHHEVNRCHTRGKSQGTYICLCQVLLRLIRYHQKSKNRDISGPIKGHVSTKNSFKKEDANKIIMKKKDTDGGVFPATNIRIPWIQFNSAEYLDSSERLFINFNAFEVLNRSVQKTNIYWNEIDSYQNGWIWQLPLCEKRINSRLTVSTICSKFGLKF